jgi:glycine cleavage system H protein
MNKILDHLLYAKTHEWVESIEEETVRIGISDFAQHELGDLVFINLPQTDDEVTADEAFGDAESVKAVSDLISPVTGIVSAVNQSVLDHPEKINENPYESWLIEVKHVTARAQLMTPDQYKAFCDEEARS